MRFSLLSFSSIVCLLTSAILLPAGSATAQLSPIKPQPIPGGPIPPISVPGFSPTPPKPGIPNKPAGAKPTTPIFYGPPAGSRGSLEYATGLFYASRTFRFRWTERRDPRGFEGTEYRRLTCQGEAQRYGESLRLRFTVRMETDTDTQYSEWIVLGGSEGGQRFHRKATEGSWTEITNATPWLTEMSNSLRLATLWQINDMYPVFINPTQTNGGRWNTYHFTANKTRDAYYLYIECGSGLLSQVMHRSTSSTVP
jgi:hypothetical protein